MNAIDRYQYRAFIMGELCAGNCSPANQADPNRAILAGLLAGRAAGLGCLPSHLGLGDEVFARAMTHFFPESPLALMDGAPEAIPEWEDLQRLLLDYRAGEHESERWITDILATACAGRDHLWQDLGLGNRDELSHLMWVNFPALARENIGDMKWKKFLYKQFCARDGIYVCPAPSCGECADRPKCFGPET